MVLGSSLMVILGTSQKGFFPAPIGQVSISNGISTRESRAGNSYSFRMGRRTAMAK